MRLAWLAHLFVGDWLCFLYLIGLSWSIAPRPQTVLSRVFCLGMYNAQAILGAFALVAITSIFCFALPFPWLFLSLSVGVHGAVFIYVFINSITFRHYHFNINRVIVGLVFGEGSDEVVQPSFIEYILFGVAILCLMGVVMGLELGLWYGLSASVSSVVLSCIGVLCAAYVVQQVLYAVCIACGTQSCLQFTYKVLLFDTLSWHSAWRRLRLPWPDGRAYSRQFKQIHKEKQVLPVPMRPDVVASHDPYRILMIVIDSWRFDMLTPDVMPTLHQLSKRCLRFQRHWSSGNTTQPGVFGLMTGELPMYWSAYHSEGAPGSFLIRNAIDQQYQCGIYGSATLKNPAFHRTVFSDVPKLSCYAYGDHPLARDQAITKKMTEFLKQRGEDRQSFFGFMFYDAAHGYFTIPDLPQHFKPVKTVNHILLNQKTDPQPIKNQYQNALVEIDRCLGDVFDQLEASRLLDDTIVVVTSDHGQEFNDLGKNYWEHPSNFARYQLQVPCLVYHPKEEPRDIHSWTTHYDVVPTLLEEALGVVPAAGEWAGSHLWRCAQEPFVLAESYTHYAAVTDQNIIEIQTDGHYQVYDHNMNVQPYQADQHHAVLEKAWRQMHAETSRSVSDQLQVSEG